MTKPLPEPSRRRYAVPGAVAIAAMVGALALYGSGLAGRNSPGETACRAARETSERLRPLARGEVAAVSVSKVPALAPDVAFTSPAGAPMRLSDLKGRMVLVNLWATWCAPCRQEMPALDRLQAKLGGPGFEVVAINVDTRNPEKPKAWLAETGITRLAYYTDPKGELLQSLQRSGQVVGLPTTLLVDASGCEIAVLRGPAEWASADAVALIRAALGRS